MNPFKVGIVGVGSIAQIVHIPILEKMDDVELVAICDIDKAKVNRLVEKFNIPRWYSMIDNMVQNEELDALHICTTSLYHFPMTYMALQGGFHVYVEKPIALNADDAQKIVQLAKEKNRTVMVGMQNRFRDDVQILKEFIQKDELGEIYYIKTGWLKKWSKFPVPDWHTKRNYAGGGVLIDIGSQLLDLALFLTALPKIRSVRLYDYKSNSQMEVEDAALAIIETETHMTITIEISWRMHMDRDVIYTNIFGKKGSAYLNPLSINKELHGNLVNVTPLVTEQGSDRFKKAYEAEINHFYRVIQGQEENQSSAEDALYIMRIIDALYRSAQSKKEEYL